MGRPGPEPPPREEPGRPAPGAEAGGAYRRRAEPENGVHGSPAADTRHAPDAPDGAEHP